MTCPLSRATTRARRRSTRRTALPCRPGSTRCRTLRHGSPYVYATQGWSQPPVYAWKASDATITSSNALGQLMTPGNGHFYICTVVTGRSTATGPGPTGGWNTTGGTSVNQQSGGKSYTWQDLGPTCRCSGDNRPGLADASRGDGRGHGAQRRGAGHLEPAPDLPGELRGVGHFQRRRGAGDRCERQRSWRHTAT